MILQMVRILPKFLNFYYVIYMDNYFTSIPLCLIFRKKNINAAGIIRSSDINFPALLIILRKK